MTTLSSFDWSIIIGYFGITLIGGLLLARKASGSLEQYYLGGRSLPWWMLGIAGMASWFDMTGTMIITAFLYLLGPRGLYIEFRGGAVLILAFLIAYAGKWHRRSGCITGAEWMTFRFGTGRNAEFVRFISALLVVVLTIGQLAYLVRGCSLFVGMFVPYSPIWVTLFILAFSTIYTVSSGFYGVVITDLIQGFIIILSCIVISFLAWQIVGSAEAFGSIARTVTGNADWMSSIPSWHTTMPAGYEAYESLLMFALFYLVRNILSGMGCGAEPRYFGARNDRECGLQSLLSGITVALRWPMMIGFAVMGIFLVAKMFPDMNSASAATKVLKKSFPETNEAQWHDVTTAIAVNPSQYSPELIAELSQVLGTSWREKLPLVSYHGNINPERILPAVLLHSVPTGLRGLILVAMLAALMSTFSGTVNPASGYLIRDIYQNFLRPQAGHWELIIGSYIATIFIVAAGCWMGITAGSINELWGWIIMGLGAGGLAPGLLRLYWWRCNAWGMIGGLVLGGLGAIIQRLTYPSMLEWKQFLLMTALSFIGTIAGSFLTKPTDMNILRDFYRKTRPFGFWKPLINELPEEEKATIKRENHNDIWTVPIALVWQVSMFLVAMQIVLHSYRDAVWTGMVFLISSFGLYWVWYRNLPKR